MNAAFLLGISLLLFIIAYKVYGRFLNRTYKINNQNKTPAHTHYDGIDFVPAKNWIILFGHHFSSICGAGPIVGPVLAVAYWGWGVSWVWILLGSILMGAVADYSSLVVSIRHQGKCISEIAHPEISPRARLLFSIFIWLAVIMVIAVFALFGAKTLVAESTAVIPSIGLIPVAVLIGFILQKRAGLATIIGLAALLSLLLLGQSYPVTLPDVFGLSSQNLWILILLFYCLIASVTPVNLLLQPRDYLASFLLIFTIALGVFSIFWIHPSIEAPHFEMWNPQELWPASGPLFPMLFVTIACGAISGFHSLVSSGTTCKQIDKESHACRIGYGGMLTEGLVAVMVLICVGAGLSSTELTHHLKNGGPIAAFSQGFGSLSSFFLGDYGSAFAILALNTFILTTLDSATRIARYLTMDIFKIKNIYLATFIVILASAFLALTGHWSRIWPAFGTANQLIAGLSLLVASCWLISRKRSFWMTLIPAFLMLLITTAAFIYQILSSLEKTKPDYLIAALSGVLILLSFIVYWEAIQKIRHKKLHKTLSN